MKVLITLLLLALSLPSWADTKDQKVARLLQLEHFDSFLNDYYASLREHYRAERQQALQKALSYYTPAPEYRQRFVEASDRYTHRVVSLYDANERLEATRATFRQQFTEAELDQLIQFYATPLGQKLIKVREMLNIQENQTYREKLEQEQKAAYQAYSQEWRQIDAACNCRKKAP